ncbi:hypothetical protein MRX96_017597 [Rhipicephalus microplus]
MESFCGSAFWDTDLSWNRRTNPDLTTCFQDTVMLWVPCSLLWFSAPFEFIAMAKSTNRRRPWTLLNITKLFFSLVLIAISLGELDQLLCEARARLSSLPSRLRSAINTPRHLRSYRFLDHRRPTRRLLHFSSTVPVLAVDQDHLGSEHKMQNLEFDFIVTVVYFPVVTCQFLISCFADLSPRLKQKVNACPETKASFISAIFFWWFNG